MRSSAISEYGIASTADPERVIMTNSTSYLVVEVVIVFNMYKPKTKMILAVLQGINIRPTELLLAACTLGVRLHELSLHE